MSAALLLYALVTGALVTLAASAVDAVARARRWPTRWIWAASLVATSVLVVSAMVAGSAPDQPATVVQASAATTPVADAAHSSPLVALVRATRALGEGLLVTAAARVAGTLPPWAAGAAALLWLAGAAAALGALAFVHLRLRRARRAWPRAYVQGRAVRVAPSVGPAVVGLVGPEIVVPRWLLDRSAEEQRLVLTHEEEHVRAHDHLLLAGACVVVALAPWHPAAWWSLARLRLAIELDCDARVLRRGVLARRYGEMLIDLAGRCSGFRLGATALADKTTHLQRRLLAMTPIPTRFTLVRAAALCAAAALSLAAACEARVPTSAEIQSMDVASAERTAAKTGLMAAMHGGVTPEFYVNGAKVTAEQAHAIPAADIATVQIEKAKRDRDAAVVRIATVATGADGAKYRSANPAALNDTDRVVVKDLHDKVTLSRHTFDGVVLIDGVQSDAAALHRLDPKDIVTVDVIKGAAAMAYSSNPAAKNGIIRVTTVRR